MTYHGAHSARRYPHRLAECSALSVGLLAVSAAHAQTVVQFEFEGVVTDDTGNTGVFGPSGSVQVDDAFTGRFTYVVGPGNPDQAAADPQLGLYHLASFEIDQAVVPIAPLGISVILEPPVATIPPQPPDPGVDAIRFVGTYPTGIDENTRPVSLRLTADYSTVFADDSLPLAPALTDFPLDHQVETIVVLGIGGESQIDAGEITSLLLVPEPSGATSVIAQIVILAACRSRRGTQNGKSDPVTTSVSNVCP